MIAQASRRPAAQSFSGRLASMNFIPTWPEFGQRAADRGRSFEKTGIAILMHRVGVSAQDGSHFRISLFSQGGDMVFTIAGRKPDARAGLTVVPMGSPDAGVSPFGVV